MQRIQYVAFTEAQVAAAGRLVNVTTPGTPGTIPTVNGFSNIQVRLRTGAHDQGVPLNQKQYGNVIIDLDPGGATTNQPVFVTPYINGEVASQATISVTGTGRQ